jgi:hypothetical protein
MTYPIFGPWVCGSNKCCAKSCACCLGMKPPNTSLDDCIKPLMSEIKELQAGYYLDLGPGDRVFVFGALGVVIQ